MAKRNADRVIYSTDDLIRLANVNSFGDYSEAVWGALIHIKNLEKLVVELQAQVAKLSNNGGDAQEETPS